jgi:hypothetical protein
VISRGDAGAARAEALDCASIPSSFPDLGPPPVIITGADVAHHRPVVAASAHTGSIWCSSIGGIMRSRAISTPPGKTLQSEGKIAPLGGTNFDAAPQ